MPVSKKRKKGGKAVKNSVAKRNQRLERAAEQPSSVSLQDLINVLAYQEYVKDGTIVPEGQNNIALSAIAKIGEIYGGEDVKVDFADNIPVNITDEEGNKHQVGTASPIPGDPEHVSIHTTDPDILAHQNPVDHLSIDKEQA